jgi:hypothetical protein
MKILINLNSNYLVEHLCSRYWAVGIIIATHFMDVQRVSNFSEPHNDQGARQGCKGCKLMICRAGVGEGF